MRTPSSNRLVQARRWSGSRTRRNGGAAQPLRNGRAAPRRRDRGEEWPQERPDLAFDKDSEVLRQTGLATSEQCATLVEERAILKPQPEMPSEPTRLSERRKSLVARYMTEPSEWDDIGPLPEDVGPLPEENGDRGSGVDATVSRRRAL